MNTSTYSSSLYNSTSTGDVLADMCTGVTLNDSAYHWEIINHSFSKEKEIKKEDDEEPLTRFGLLDLD